MSARAACDIWLPRVALLAVVGFVLSILAFTIHIPTAKTIHTATIAQTSTAQK